jgi:hypothetical protein
VIRRDTLVEAYGQFDPLQMEKVEAEHALDRDLVRAVHNEDTQQVENLLMGGANAMKRFYLGQERIDYSDFSRPQHLLPMQFYTHSPLMVSVLNESIAIMDMLLESHPLTPLESVHLFKYAIDQHKMIALECLLRHKGYPLALDKNDDLIKYAITRRVPDAVLLMSNQRDSLDVKGV